MVPLVAYSVRPLGYEKQCTPTDVVSRQVFYCWDTLTEFEVNQIATIKVHMRDVLELTEPPNFDDREWLKFL